MTSELVWQHDDRVGDAFSCLTANLRDIMVLVSYFANIYLGGLDMSLLVQVCQQRLEILCMHIKNNSMGEPPCTSSITISTTSSRDRLEDLLWRCIHCEIISYRGGWSTNSFIDPHDADFIKFEMNLIVGVDLFLDISRRL